jgi:hypothetical protein
MECTLAGMNCNPPSSSPRAKALFERPKRIDPNVVARGDLYGFGHAFK